MTQDARFSIESALSLAIIEDAADAIIANSLDGTVITWNACAARLFGCTAAEMIGGPISRVVPPDRLHEQSEFLARLVLGKSITHFVTRRIRKDGSHFDVSLTLSPVRDASGKIVAVSTIVRDITETQQQQLAFALSAAIVEHSDDAIISKSLDGTVLTWNAGAARIFGYTAAEMIGGPITRLFPADRLHEEAELIAQLANGKKISHFVTQRLRKSGSSIDVSVTLSPVRDAGGKIVAVSKIARDITEAYQRQFASALAAAIVEHSDDAIISKTLDGTVITWNLGAQQIFGYAATEMIGGPITRLFPADRLPEEPELITQLLLGKSVDHFLTRRLHKDGTSIDVSVTLSPVRDAHGQIVAVSKMVREVTAARQWNIAEDVLIPGAAKMVAQKPSARSKTAPDRATDVRARANRALREKIDELVRNQQRFQALVRLTSQVIWTNNPQGRMEGSQPAWAAFTGQSFDDYQGLGWSAAVHPEDVQTTIDEWNRCVGDRRPFLFEHRLLRHDGVFRTCTINAVPILNDDGSVREWVGVHNDITERRQHEDEIRAQEARFRFLTESLPQIVWTSRPDGLIDYYNQRWFDYTGMTLEQTQGWGWAPVLHPDDLQNIIRLWSHSVATGEPLETECRFRRAFDGTDRWHLNRAVPLRDAHGTIVKWFGTSTDIHDYKEAEAKNLALRAELEGRVRQRTAELERVGKIAGVGGWSFTVATGAVYWSDESCRILDVQPGHQPTLDEALGMYIPDSREVLEGAHRNCIANAVPYDLELQLTTAKGRGIWVRTVGEAQIEQGTLVRIFGAFQDITAHKLAELELFDHHELLRVTLDSIGDAVITTDALGRVQSLNPVAARLTGRSAIESRGLPVEEVFDIVDAETKQRTLELMARALSNDATGGTGVYTILTSRDGTEVGIEDSVAPIRDKTGRMVGSVLVFRDVSERQRAAHSLRRANERFALAADAAGIGVWEWDLSSNALRWDDQMYRLYGRMPIPGEEPYALWASSLHAEDRERAEREINEAIRDNASLDTEFRIVQPSGEIRHLSAAAQIQTDGAGAAIRMIGVNFDITARKRAELDLKHTSSLLRNVLDSAKDLSIIATAPDLTIRVFNKGAEHMLGYAGAEFIDSATLMAFHDAAEVEARRLELSTLLGRSVQGAAVFTESATLDVPREWTYIRKDQRRVPVVLNVSPIFDDSRTLSGYLGVARDITREREHDRSLREATSQAERANAAKSEFLSNMSHEIRTPLNAVIGLGYLLEQTTLTEDQRQFVAKIQFAGRSLLSVVNNVLDLSKIEAGEMVLEDESFDLPVMIREIVAMLAPQATDKGIELLVPPLSGIPRAIRGDATRLSQVLTNLLSNSIKFTESGRVDLNVFFTEQDSERMRLRCEVKDSGIGIEAAALDRLFTPFSQADASTTRRFGGTGLGLSIARRCVELMGGEIGVTSTVAVGSTFWFEIPLRTARSIGGMRGTEGEPGFKLIVADSKGDAPDGLGAMVRALGWSPQMVATGERLFEVMNNTGPETWPDVLILDLRVFAEDGAEMIARIQKGSTHGELPPFIVVADRVESYLQHQPSMRNKDVFLVRPVNSSALFNAINSAVWGQRDSHERILQSTNFDELQAHWLAGVRLLVVDDSRINLEVAQRILEKQGATVVTCSDGRAAVEYVRANHEGLDLVLMDVQMPILDGNEATRRIRNELGLPSLPIVALTAGALVGERQRAIDAGMNDFVSKPFDPAVLIRKVRCLVEQARGAPIPMVIIDDKPASRVADPLHIPSIDAAVVRRMFGDDHSLFHSLLVRMLRDNADLALPVSVPPDGETAKMELKGRVHKLKGSAGMIGATGIARLAAAAETAVQRNSPVEAVASILNRLASALTTLREEADLSLTTRPEPDAAGGVANRPHVSAAEIDELRALLESQNLEAVDRFAALFPSLRDQMDTDRFNRLQAAVDDLDFQLAADVLRDAPWDDRSQDTSKRSVGDITH
jgi:PAS domain S-box-containing protein